MRLSSFFLLLGGMIWLSQGNSEMLSAPWPIADWRTQQSKTRCLLKHSISGFGYAAFQQTSGEPLKFFLQPQDQETQITQASLFVEAAPWHDYLAYQGDYPVFVDNAGFDYRNRLMVSGEPAEIMLNSLFQGESPVFSLIRQATETRVAITSINFSEAYLQFLDCRQGLLPFNQMQLEQGSLYFLPNSAELSSQVKQHIQQVAAYLQEIPNSKVILSNETASVVKAKDKLFSARTKRIVERLQKLGVAAGRIQIKAAAGSRPDDNIIVLKVSGPETLRVIYYRKGNTQLNAAEKQRLTLLARYINDFFDSGRVIINSHTDSRGKKATNLAISQQRGDVVKAYLESQGVAPDRIQVEAYGESRPAKSNRYPAGQAMNRRVVIDLIK